MKPVAALLGCLALFALAAMASAATVEYDLTIDRQKVNFTDQTLEALTVNGHLPAPTLRFGTSLTGCRKPLICPVALRGFFRIAGGHAFHRSGNHAKALLYVPGNGEGRLSPSVSGPAGAPAADFGGADSRHSRL